MAVYCIKTMVWAGWPQISSPFLHKLPDQPMTWSCDHKHLREPITGLPSLLGKESDVTNHSN